MARKIPARTRHVPVLINPITTNHAAQAAMEIPVHSSPEESLPAEVIDPVRTDPVLTSQDLILRVHQDEIAGHVNLNHALNLIQETEEKVQIGSIQTDPVRTDPVRIDPVRTDLVSQTATTLPETLNHEVSSNLKKDLKSLSTVQIGIAVISNLKVILGQEKKEKASGQGLIVLVPTVRARQTVLSQEKIAVLVNAAEARNRSLKKKILKSRK